MSLIKIFPCYGETTERNIQANIVGSVYGLNIYLHESKSCVDFYLEIPLIAGVIYLRCGSIYDRPYKVEDYLPKTIEKITQVYTSSQDIVSKQIELYGKIWAGMCLGELTHERNSLRNYNLLCIIFGPIILLEEFHRVWVVLNDKYNAQKLLAAENKEKENAMKNALADVARKEAEFELNERIKKGEKISGNELVGLCKDYNIEMHIRTQGTISRKVSEVCGDTYRVQRGTQFKIDPCQYYKQVKSIIEGNPIKQIQLKWAYCSYTGEERELSELPDGWKWGRNPHILSSN